MVKENRKLLETVHAESEKRKRLAFQNEELLWKLKRSTQVAKTLAVFNSNRGKEQSGNYFRISPHNFLFQFYTYCYNYRTR